MVDRFQALPQQNDTELAPLEITPDVSSYLEDIESGAIKSIQELEARFQTAKGGLVQERALSFSTQYLRDSQGRALTENREVSQPAKKGILTETKIRQEIDSNQIQSTGFIDYLGDIAGGKITDTTELTARLATIPGNYVVDPRNQFSTGYFRDSEGRVITENRQVNPEQKKRYY